MYVDCGTFSMSVVQYIVHTRESSWEGSTWYLFTPHYVYRGRGADVVGVYFSEYLLFAFFALKQSDHFFWDGTDH